MNRILGGAVAASVLFAASAGAGGGAVALQTAATSCPDDSGDRYVNCSYNGTVTDNDTGLVWLANANCFGLLDWHEAMEVVAGLADLPNDACGPLTPPDLCDCGLIDGSSPGECRLPSIAEWQAMVDDAVAMECSPAIATNWRTDCWEDGCQSNCFLGYCECSFRGVQPAMYWSSTSFLGGIENAWAVDLSDGSLDFDLQKDTHSLYAWPVRGGQ